MMEKKRCFYKVLKFERENAKDQTKYAYFVDLQNNYFTLDRILEVCQIMLTQGRFEHINKKSSKPELLIVGVEGVFQKGSQCENLRPLR